MSPDTRRDDQGFTLIELLVVVIIIGILAAIAIPTFLRQREKAWRTEAIHDMKNAALAVETYATETDSYAGLDGADQNNPVIQSEGFKPSAWVNFTVSATDTTYCIEGQNQFVPGKTFVFSSNGGVLQIGLSGVLQCP